MKPYSWSSELKLVMRRPHDGYERCTSMCEQCRYTMAVHVGCCSLARLSSATRTRAQRSDERDKEEG